MSSDEAEKVLTAVGIGRNDEFISLLQEIPSRAHRNVQNPNDPTIKRLQEVVDVYGPSIKAITHELCGDGIISAIDCQIDVNKKEDPKGDRVVITIDGKFLKYQPWWGINKEIWDWTLEDNLFFRHNRWVNWGGEWGVVVKSLK